MTYEILDKDGNRVKIVQSNATEEEILRNFPIGFTIKELKIV